MGQSSCVFCGKGFSVDALSHVCAHCGGPQPVSQHEDFFALLGAPRGFRQDLGTLEKRYYEISRALHPDRFAAGADSKWKVISVERMSVVNRAYQTLTKADRLREYLLELEGVARPGDADAKTATIPAELAEAWFELQDELMEKPEIAVERLAQFEKELRARSAELRTRIEVLEEEYDRRPGESRGNGDAGETLRKIEKLSLDGQYLRSMERDLLKLRARLGI